MPATCTPAYKLCQALLIKDVLVMVGRFEALQFVQRESLSGPLVEPYKVLFHCLLNDGVKLL